MLKMKTFHLLTIILVSAVILTACGPSEEELAAEANLAITQAVETAMAGLTETAILEPTPTFTLTPTSEPSPTGVPTAVVETYTPSPAQPTAPSGGQTGPGLSSCDLASFVDDLTIPDDTELAPGQPFKKTWRIKMRAPAPGQTSIKCSIMAVR